MSDEQEEKIEGEDGDVGEVGKEAEYLAGWKRALADYDNLKKDLGRERGDMRLAAAADAVMRLVPVLDNFDVATKFVPDNVDDKLRNWLTGILFIQTQLENALKEMGAEPYGEVGDTFDANLHDAVGEREDVIGGVPAPRHDGESCIVEIVARGWKIGERIIRPAKVIVNK